MPSRLLALSLGLCATLAAPPLGARVVISEIAYHPAGPDSKLREFVELHNSGPREVSLAGWSFREGIEFTFPPGASIAAGEQVIVARDPALVREEFALGADGVYGGFSGTLDNGGELLTLVDTENAVRDRVRYDDDWPWAEAADGQGPSLQRRCPEALSWRAESWDGTLGHPPSPLSMPPGPGPCPPPPPPTPAVVINEIHYHPAGDADAFEEYVELHNPGEGRIDLEGWSLEDGVSFTFGAGSAIEPGGYLLVARDAEALRERFGEVPVAGEFEVGGLSNRGERLLLVDAAGQPVDAAVWRDQGDWPPGADGLGRSLERIRPSAPGYDPASWAHSRLIPGPFGHVEAVAPVGDLVIQRFVMGIDGPGEFIVDNVILEPADGSGPSRLPNGDFEGDFQAGGWERQGNAAGSQIEEGIGVDGSRGLRLLSTGDCGGDPCGSVDSISYRFDLNALPAGVLFRLAFDYRYVSGSTDAYARLLRGPEISFERATVTPGGANSAASLVLPPLVSAVGRFPIEPTSADATRITALVRADRGDSVTGVTLAWLRSGSEPSGETAVEMRDDGAHGDGEAGDGVWGAELPRFPHSSSIHYRIFARTARGASATSPRPLDEGSRRPSEVWGLYVNDDQPVSQFPVWHLLIPGVDAGDPLDVNSELDCFRLEPMEFAARGELIPDVRVRFRGNTACVVAKRNFKLRFPRGRDFEGVHKINLQGLWTDKSLVREHLAWDLFRQLGVPYCQSGYVRVHLNGQYHGLFLRLEHPDHRYLQRNGLDEDGYLYKAKQPPRDPDVVPIGVERQPSLSEYERYWEKETREEEDLSPLAGFIDALHADADLPAGPTVAFMEQNVIAEQLIGYQVAQVALDNIDSFAKNHFLYQDSRTGQWGLLGWDVDLVFGKFFDPDVVEPGVRPVGTLNDCMLGDLSGDLNPWFTTRVRGNRLLHHFVDKFFRAGTTVDGGAWYQRAYLVRLQDVMAEKVRRDVYDPILAELVATLGDEAAEDLQRWGRYPSNPDCPVPDEMEPNVETLAEQIRTHRERTLDYIRTYHPGIADHPRLEITELMADPEGASEELEFIELFNPGESVVDAAGWSIVGGIGYLFPAGVEVAPGEHIVVAKDPGAFGARYPTVAADHQVLGPYQRLLSNDGERLWVRDAGPGYPATVDYLEYGTEGEWPEGRDGRSIELVARGADRDNDFGGNWRLSALVGGTPGTEGMLFVRGDADRSGSLSLTDAVFTLLYLFQGGEPPLCLDAADADDDGRILINDPILLLSFLFLGGRPVPAPYPEPGVDPTADALPCGATP